MTEVRRKVFAYITKGDRLLVFAHPNHPNAGIQVPGGTLEEGETPEEGALREAQEETGLNDLSVVSFLGEHGVDIAGFEWHGAPGGNDAYEMPVELFLRSARAIDGPKVDAFLIPDTAIAGFPILRTLEAELSKPVLAAHQVTLWEGLRLAGWREAVPGFGRLMERF